MSLTTGASRCQVISRRRWCSSGSVSCSGAWHLRAAVIKGLRIGLLALQKVMSRPQASTSDVTVSCKAAASAVVSKPGTASRDAHSPGHTFKRIQAETPSCPHCILGSAPHAHKHGSTCEARLSALCQEARVNPMPAANQTRDDGQACLGAQPGMRPEIMLIGLDVSLSLMTHSWLL